jgi:hypothetical protein
VDAVVVVVLSCEWMEACELLDKTGMGAGKQCLRFNSKGCFLVLQHQACSQNRAKPAPGIIVWHAQTMGKSLVAEEVDVTRQDYDMILLEVGIQGIYFVLRAFRMLLAASFDVAPWKTELHWLHNDLVYCHTRVIIRLVAQF